MQIKVFHVPVAENGEMLAELNRFLAGNKILEVNNQFCQSTGGGCWSFCVKYLPQTQPGQVPLPNTRSKVDYKEVLSQEEFEIFAKLRECRKAIAAEDGIPPFAVFVDEELAGLSRLSEITITSMKTVHGIGDKKAERYGKRLVTMFNGMVQAEKTKNESLPPNPDASLNEVEKILLEK